MPHLGDLFAVTDDHLLTTRKAREAGFGPGELRALVKLGIIRRLIRGWYAAPQASGEPPPWEGDNPFETSRVMHRLLVAALVRSFEGRVVASHQSSLVLNDVELWRSDLDTAQLCRTSDEHSRHRRRAIIHPACGVPPDVVDGIGAVPVAVACVQVGLLPVIGGHRYPLESLVAANSALHRGQTTLADLTDALALHEGVPGIRSVRELLQHADARVESVGETRMLHNLRLLGYDVEPQREVVVAGRAYRIDGKLRGHNVFVEFDGMSKYLPVGTVTAEGEKEARRRLALEKDRQDAISRQTGAVFERFVWKDLDHLHGMDQRMLQAIARSDRRRSA